MASSQEVAGSTTVRAGCSPEQQYVYSPQALGFSEEWCTAFSFLPHSNLILLQEAVRRRFLHLQALRDGREAKPLGSEANQLVHVTLHPRASANPPLFPGSL